MHTVRVISMGLGLLAVFCLIGYFTKSYRGLASVALIFIPVWLAGALLNMYIGVKRAGYTVAQELPITVVVFLVPAVLAIAVYWKFKVS